MTKVRCPRCGSYNEIEKNNIIKCRYCDFVFEIKNHGLDRRDITLLSIVSFGLIVTALMSYSNGYDAGMVSSNPHDKIERAILAVHNAHDYIDTPTYSYVCRNYTIDAIKAINEMGEKDIRAYFVHGDLKDNENEAHAWVRVCKDYDVTAGLTAPDYDDYSKIFVYKPEFDDGRMILSGEFVQK